LKENILGTPNPPLALPSKGDALFELVDVYFLISILLSSWFFWLSKKGFKSSLVRRFRGDGDYTLIS